MSIEAIYYSSKRICENSNQEQDFNFPAEILQSIFVGDERLIQRGKMACKNYHAILTSHNTLYWTNRLVHRTVHTEGDVSLLPQIFPNLEKLALVYVRNPLESWKVIPQLKQLRALKLHTEFNYYATVFEKYEDLKRKDGSLPSKFQVEKQHDIERVVQQIATLPYLTDLEVCPGQLFLDNASSLTNLNLKRLYLGTTFSWNENQIQFKLLELANFSSLRELRFGTYNISDRYVFPVLQKLPHLEKLELTFIKEESNFRDLGKLTTLRELSLKISNKSQLIFQEIQFLVLLSKLHLRADRGLLNQISAEVIAISMPLLKEMREFYIQNNFEDREKDLTKHLFWSLPNLQIFVGGCFYKLDSSQPEGYRTTKLIGNYGNDFWNASSL